MYSVCTMSHRDRKCALRLRIRRLTRVQNLQEFKTTLQEFKTILRFKTRRLSRNSRHTVHGFKTLQEFKEKVARILVLQEFSIYKHSCKTCMQEFETFKDSQTSLQEFKTCKNSGVYKNSCKVCTFKNLRLAGIQDV